MALNTPDRSNLMGMRVRLRSHVRVHRHVYRGEAWTVLEDPATGRTHRLDPAAQEALALLDGARTLAEAQAALAARHGTAAPSGEDLLGLVATLYTADLLAADARPDLEELATRGARQRKARLRQYFTNPLALRFPLVDPDRFLERAAAWTRAVPNALVVALWLLALAGGIATAATNWTTLAEGGLDRIFSLGNLAVLWLCYPVVKLLHEIGHGIVVRRLGGQVHEMGVMVLVLVPVPYVDASAAAAFPSKRARMLVGAAGILTELFLASLAVMLWALLEPGALRSLCFNVALIAGVSTLLFNGNPLLRFDGYYVLADWLEIPNLGQRANAFLGWLVKEKAFGMGPLPSPAASAAEARWLFSYSVGSSVYRLFISFAIALAVASHYFFVGVLLGLWALASMLVLPLLRGLRWLAGSAALGPQRGRALRVTGAFVAILAAGLFLLPAPYWTRTEGLVWAPERSHLRAGTACFVREVKAASGTQVRRGDPLIACEDPELAANARVLEAQLMELRARDMAYYVGSRLHLDVLREEIVHIEERLADTRRRLASLELASPADGRFIMASAADAPGRHVQRGELLGYVLEPGPVTVRVAVQQGDADLVRGSTRGVSIKAADRLEQSLEARVLREVPGASDRLPGPALAVMGGGPFPSDPRSQPDGEGGPRAIDPLFVLDLDASGLRDAPLGLRVHVRFAHPATPLGQQWYRAARRLLLKQFNV